MRVCGTLRRFKRWDLVVITDRRKQHAPFFQKDANMSADREIMGFDQGKRRGIALDRVHDPSF